MSRSGQVPSPEEVLRQFECADSALVRATSWWPLDEAFRLRQPQGSFLLLAVPGDLDRCKQRAALNRFLVQAGVPAPLFKGTRDGAVGFARDNRSTWVMIAEPAGRHSAPHPNQAAAAGALLARAHTCLEAVAQLKGREAFPRKPAPLVPPMLGRVDGFLRELGSDEQVLRDKIREIREGIRQTAEVAPDGPLLGGLSPVSLLVAPLGGVSGLRWVEPSWGPQWLEVALSCYEFCSQYRWAASPDIAEAFLLGYSVARFGPQLTGLDACQAALAPVDLRMALFAAGLVSKLREVAHGVAPVVPMLADEIGHLPEAVQQVYEVLSLPSSFDLLPGSEGAETQDGGTAPQP